MSLNVLRTGVPLVATFMLAACGSGGGSLPPAKALATPTPIPVTAPAALQLMDRSRTNSSENRSEKSGDSTGGSHDSSAPGPLKFACPTSPSQTIVLTDSHAGELPRVVLSKDGIVTVSVAKSDRQRRHGQDDSETNGESSTSIIVTPVAAGSTSIRSRSGDDEDRGTTIYVVVGTCGTPPPLPPVATFTSALVDCTNPALACGRVGYPVIGGALKGVVVPRDALSISEPGYSGTFTVASLDGNCGTDGILGPEVLAATAPVTTVYAGLSYTGFTTAAAGTKIGDVKDVSCAFSVADQNGGKATASFVYRLKFPL